MYGTPFYYLIDKLLYHNFINFGYVAYISEIEFMISLIELFLLGIMNIGNSITDIRKSNFYVYIVDLSESRICDRPINI
jgi:hypothetical protein